MDPKKKDFEGKYESSSNSLYWTNERHVHFLNSIEASFVQTLLENNNNAAPILPLDRHLPDSTDSTLDTPKERRRRFSTSDINMSSGSRIDVEKKTRRMSSIISSQDQVVPQYKHGRGDKDADGHPSVPLN
ncbi:uncharacterized protein LOC107014335 [Solanum pennellii]|uniref:Uncharacterized protein LOC107014335 n=1 Tax=Solanum pennellii TaxID=28526 RepID=A0ABM1GDS5_SOLPN|nr:uncharacterized protein LOC107014335 [Solanum pennellii]